MIRPETAAERAAGETAYAIVARHTQMTIVVTELATAFGIYYAFGASVVEYFILPIIVLAMIAHVQLPERFGRAAQDQAINEVRNKS